MSNKMVCVCHMTFTGRELLLSPESIVTQIDDADLYSLRPKGAERGRFPAIVDEAAIRQDIARLRATRWPSARAVICLLNFERCDDWQYAAAYIRALIEILREGDGFSSVYLYDWCGEPEYDAADLDGRMVPMNAERDVLAADPRIVPMLHPIEWKYEPTLHRIRDLVERGHRAVVIWSVSRTDMPGHDPRERALLLAKLEGYWSACVDIEEAKA